MHSSQIVTIVGDLLQVDVIFLVKSSHEADQVRSKSSKVKSQKLSSHSQVRLWLSYVNTYDLTWVIFSDLCLNL